jgi:hypothetical protein
VVDVPLLNRIFPHFLLLAGIVTMGFAGLRYWESDPFRFLLTPPWKLWIRPFFQRPGYRLYIIGCTLALLGPALLVLRYVLQGGNP